MGFNKRKMEDARRQEAEKEAARRRATELVCLSKSSVAEEYYAERSGNRWVRG